MILTPHLEQLIWDGCAKYETWTIGTAAAGLEVKDNETIIIIGFDYFDFIDTDVSDDDYSNWIQFINKQITLSSPNRRENFLYRSQLNFNMNSLDQTVRVRTVGAPKHYDCYLPFCENISVNIATIPSPEKWIGLTIAPAPTPSRQKPTPLGYGVADSPNIPTVQQVQQTAASQSKAFKAFVPGVTLAQTYKDWQVPFSAATEILAPSLEQWGGQTYPCMTVHYVRINKRMDGKFM